MAVPGKLKLMNYESDKVLMSLVLEHERNLFLNYALH